MEVFEIGKMREYRTDTLLCNLVHVVEAFPCEGVEARIPSPFIAELVRLSAVCSKEDFIVCSNFVLELKKKRIQPPKRSAGSNLNTSESSLAVYFSIV